VVDRDLFIFAAVDSERVNISAANTSNEANFGVFWRLLRRDGTAVSGCNSTFGLSQDCGPLQAADSPYPVEVIDSAQNATGSFALRLTRLSHPCEELPLPCGVMQ